MISNRIDYDAYLIVSCRKGQAVSVESNANQVFYTEDIREAMLFDTGERAEESPYFVLGDSVMPVKEFAERKRLSLLGASGKTIYTVALEKTDDGSEDLFVTLPQALWMELLYLGWQTGDQLECNNLGTALVLTNASLAERMHNPLDDAVS